LRGGTNERKIPEVVLKGKQKKLQRKGTPEVPKRIKKRQEVFGEK